MGQVDARSYVTGFFGLELDGLDCGLIQKIEGGSIEAEVTFIPMSDKYFVAKQVSSFRYKEFTAQLGLAMGQPVLDWIQASLHMSYLRKNGAVKAADFTRSVRFIREFHDALLSEITFPACDAASKDPAFLTLKFSPERIANRKGDGSVIDAAVDSRQKMFHPSNFALTIDGLEANCAKINKVEALTIKQTVVDDDTDGKDDPKEPGHIEMPNLKVSVAQEHAYQFEAWHEDFVINGNNDETKERSGSLTYYDSTRTKALLELTFRNVGIFKVATDASVNNEDKIARTSFEMYVEQVSAKFL